MPQNPAYFPTRNADQATWATNFNTLLTANPTDYGLTAPDAVIVDGVVDTFIAALATATNPATRTPVAIAAKDAALAAMKAVVFPYATQIAGDASVSNGLKTGIGVTVRITTRTRNPIVTAEIETSYTQTLAGLLNFRASDPATPLTKQRPLGAFGWELQIQTATTTAPGTWIPAYSIVQSKPTAIVGPADFEETEDLFRYRARWAGPALNGGAPNVGPWNAWQDVFPAV